MKLASLLLLLGGGGSSRSDNGCAGSVGKGRESEDPTSQAKEGVEAETSVPTTSPVLQNTDTYHCDAVMRVGGGLRCVHLPPNVLRN